MTKIHGVEYAPRSSLTPSPRNARTHSKAQIKQIAASIEEFGFLNPILIRISSSIQHHLTGVRLNSTAKPCTINKTNLCDLKAGRARRTLGAKIGKSSTIHAYWKPSRYFRLSSWCA